jgi:hypothetical protein
VGVLVGRRVGVAEGAGAGLGEDVEVEAANEAVKEAGGVGEEGIVDVVWQPATSSVIPNKARITLQNMARSITGLG